MDRVNIAVWDAIVSLEMHPDRSISETDLPVDLCPHERKELLMRLAQSGFQAYIRESYTSGQIKTTLITERQK